MKATRENIPLLARHLTEEENKKASKLYGINLQTTDQEIVAVDMSIDYHIHLPEDKELVVREIRNQVLSAGIIIIQPGETRGTVFDIDPPSLRRIPYNRFDRDSSCLLMRIKPESTRLGPEDENSFEVRLRKLDKQYGIDWQDVIYQARLQLGRKL